ncbi:phage tail family protein [Alkalihalophilus marmarensis]|uniref:Phage tail component, N-terminal domain-containing protein n=1 Tax=Alkalihalophilus marmarensis DSM 21297 TaxID=1188261 RepID=U6SMA6_9BACI|nr:distal tail protein Dit [Alkalihalophilus marmarensis]ERN52824.1 hypothetical protein A33I_14100 [Alkalihalophilus marmarensis DSM 21297]MCM3489075.1 phage tail family protein [Alkalihalophilus marmarensis]
MPHFNGIDLRKWVIVEDKTRSLAPPIYNDLVEVPATNGAYQSGQRLGVRQIAIPVTFIGTNRADWMLKAKHFIGHILTNEPKPLWFSDEPDVYYNAILSGDTNLEEFVQYGRTTLLFVCADPFKYDTQETKVNLNDGSTTVHYDGTYETKPRFKITFNQPVTHFEIKNHLNERILLGKPAAMTDTIVDPEELVFMDTMNSTSNWVLPDSVDNGYLEGEMSSSGGRFYPSLYGVGISPRAWQGPSLKRSIGASLQDFRVDVLVNLENVGFETGMMEVYLLDANNVTVAKIGVEDIWQNVAQVQGKFQLGPINNRMNMYALPDIKTGWNNYDGILRIVRVGNEFRPYWAKIDQNGNHNWVLSQRRYVDYDSRYANRITQIQLAARIWPSTAPSQQSFKEIKVFRLNQAQNDSQVANIAQTGDVIEIDTATQSIRKNGEVFLINDLSSEFFSLFRGENVLDVTPGVAEVEMSYERRWL